VNSNLIVRCGKYRGAGRKVSWGYKGWLEGNGKKTFAGGQVIAGKILLTNNKA